jgi:hypothetical protein
LGHGRDIPPFQLFEGSAIAAGLGRKPDGAGLFDPSLGSQNKAVQTSLFSKPIEFDGFKIGVVELLPDAEKLDGVVAAQPNVLYRYYT